MCSYPYIVSRRENFTTRAASLVKMAEEEDISETIAKESVVKKYKAAGGIVNEAFKLVVSKCVPGARIMEICEIGDRFMKDETAKLYKKDKEMKKGIAFPTCVSVNNCICHFSPLRTDADVTLDKGDVVKIDLGAHIDGYCSVAAMTFVVGATPEEPATEREADVIMAAYTASEVALRLVKPGTENFKVTESISKVTEAFQCKPIEGMLSHQLQRNVIDGPKTIILNPSEAQRKEQEKCEFAVNEVYGIDVLVSTGEGKGREMDTRTTVFKKKDTVYNLKMKTSRQFFSEADKKFGTMAFTIRSMDDERKAKMGVIECVKHDLVDSFNVLYDKPGEFVAQFKFTVLLLPDGSLRINDLPFNPKCYNSKHTMDDKAVLELLSQPTSKKDQDKLKQQAQKEVESAVIK